jgi:hypothetical protein
LIDDAKFFRHSQDEQRRMGWKRFQRLTEGIQSITGGRGRGSGFGLALDTNSTITYQEIPLYPKMTLPSYRQTIPQEDELFEIETKMWEEFRKSAYHLDEPTNESTSRPRYADRFQVVESRTALHAHLLDIDLDMSLLPDELNLLSSKYTPKKSTRSFALDNIDKLEKDGEKDKDGDKNREDVEIEDDVMLDEDELDDVIASNCSSKKRMITLLIVSLFNLDYDDEVDFVGDGENEGDD